MRPEELHKKILEEYRPFFKQIGVEKLEELSQMDKIINELSKNDGSLKMIFDNRNYKILAVSDNIEALTGYTKTEFQNANVMLYFRALEFEHLLAPLILGRWFNNMFKHIKTLEHVAYHKLQVAYCGIKMKRKNGEKGRTLQRYIPLAISETGFPDIALSTGDDIKHLLKSDFYWVRLSCGDLPTHKFYYSSADKKTHYQDIVSEREKDVLRLIMDGLESKEIAQTLFISTHTVENHRRNAIARTGARDTTALIQICRMCGIL
ncbi:MAG: helix-turn-helix transcriptional regulator [Saprospiraceae bacterium]|nr:helix-turn-helix transcriptional regulator [Saprospiraceae bacterium]